MMASAADKIEQVVRIGLKNNQLDLSFFCWDVQQQKQSVKKNNKNKKYYIIGLRVRHCSRILLSMN